MEDRETRWPSAPTTLRTTPIDGFEILITHAQELEGRKGTRNADHP
jgi:hypothetical protein